MIDRVKTRLGSEQGFTLIELLVVIVILGILVAIAVPSYLSFRGNAQDAAAKSNVRSAIPAAEGYFQTTGSYTSMDATALQSQAPGVSVTDVVVSGDDAAYCIDDTQGTHSAYYIGGDQDINSDGNGFAALSGATVSAVTGGATCSDVGATSGS
jgi:type IV pilus assembly protein PilA